LQPGSSPMTGNAPRIHAGHSHAHRSASLHDSLRAI
jgi:hypothetical protein